MITEELLEFLRTQQSAGMKVEEMERLLLVEGGWNKTDVDDAFRQLGIGTSGLVLENQPEPLGDLKSLESVADERKTPDVFTSVALPATPVESTPVIAEIEEPASPVSETIPADEVIAQDVAGTRTDVAFEGELRYQKAEDAGTVAVKLQVERSAPEAQLPHTSEMEGMSPLAPQDEIQNINREVSDNTTRENQGIPVEIDEIEDFLGLFNAPEPAERAPEVLQIPPLPREEILVPKLEPIPPNSSTGLPEQVVPGEHVQESINTLAQDISPVVSELPDSQSPPDVTPMVFGKKPEWTFQDLIAQKKSEPKVPPTPVLPATEKETPPEPKEESPTFQFDLSRIASPTEKEVVLPPTPEVAKAVLNEKSLETKSLADVFRSGQSTAVVEPSSYSSTTVRKSLQARRTMSSDLIRGGGGVSTPAMPALSTENLPKPVELPHMEKPLPPPPPPAETKSSVVVVTSPVSLAEGLKKRNKIKRLASLILGVLVLFLLVAGSFTFLMSHRGLTDGERFSSALTQFAGVSTMSYSGDAFADLVLSAPSSGEGVAQNGKIKFNLRYSGALQNSTEGYGDGTHRFKLSGGLRSGTYEWNTDVESDVRVMENSLFFHFLSYPALTDLDPEIMNGYWIKVDLTTLMKELSLAQSNSSGSGYGNFGSGKPDFSFNTLFSANQPFVLDGVLPDEQISGSLATHVKLKADKEKMFALAIPLYKKYFGKDLVLTAPQQLRLKDALGKIVAEAWLDPVTNQLRKVMIRGDFDDDMGSARVKGNTQATFTFSDQGKAVVVTEPTPFLTLEEFRARSDEYQKNKEFRVIDNGKLERLEHIISALSVYQKEKNRYPATLLELRSSGKLPATLVDDFTLIQYSYLSYLTPDILSKAGRCTAKGKNCAFYHLGVNLEDLTNPALNTDADVNSEMNGKDSTGCGGEMNLSCFDVVSTSLSVSTSTDQTASSTSR